MSKKVPDWILTSQEEKLLSGEDRLAYYKRLRKYCEKRKLANTTIGATTVAPKLKKATEAICKRLCKIGCYFGTVKWSFYLYMSGNNMEFVSKSPPFAS